MPRVTTAKIPVLQADQGRALASRSQKSRHESISLFIRSQGCLVCQKNADAHHLKLAHPAILGGMVGRP